MSTLQKKMQGMLDAAVAEGRERGMQLAVYYDGESVVDAWAGHMDSEKSKPVDGDTLFPVFSVTKGITATAAHQAVERGLIDYDTPIAKVWPEFAANGKGAITLRHVLTHTSGMQLLPAGMVADDLYDWDKLCRLLAAAAPAAAPGEAQVYHAITYGLLIGELLRRVDGRPIQRIVREDISEPLGVRDLHIGIPQGVDDPVATLEDPHASPPPEHDIPLDVPRCLYPIHAWMN